MKLISFTRLGTPGFGAAVDGGIVELTGHLDPDILTLKDAICADVLDLAQGYIQDLRPDLGWADIALLPVIPDPAQIFCIGVNYVAHREETGRSEVGYPTIFTRFADSQIAHGQPLVKPTVSDRFDCEGEMAIVIGQGGRNIAAKDAMNHVAGYSCYNDGSVRDWQRHTSQFTPGKNFSGSGAFGPYLVTPDEVGDYTKLPIQTRLNGQILQDATLADLIFPIPQLIEYISQFTPLSPGDVIATGTPGGVGDKRVPPIYMQPGDTVEVDLGLLGTLRNPVIAEGAP